MILVAVSQRVDAWPDRREWRDSLDQRLFDFLLAAGCLPVPVPNRLLDSPGGDVLARWMTEVKPAAVVLSGGNDVGQCLTRDRTEQSLLDLAEREELPVLGICRGMQMIGVRAGVELRAVAGHVRTRHTVTGTIARDVNSYHTTALAACPDGFEVLARSADGQIEAIRHRSLRWEGWMWHPEREAVFDPYDLERLRRLFESRERARLAHRGGPPGRPATPA